ncbi:MAG: glycosyltransferase family 4 protein [Anaerolineales bacterium]|nr:glycosyltransferase family 4 protein [Anaerolineales bacterium]
MKLAYVSVFDPSDIHAWSGTGTHILGALQSRAFQIKTIGGLKYTYDFIYKAKEVLYPRIFSQTYKMLWDPILLKQFALQVERELAFVDYDVVFSIWSNPIAYLRINKPIVFWGDATFAGLTNFHPGYRNLCAETVHYGNRAEQLALSKCRLAIYSSEWAADTAIQCYKVDPAKVKVVPFGANIDSNRDLDAIRDILSKKVFDTCVLLLVGTDWYWKGADIAAAITELLNERGVKTELHIVGCTLSNDPPDFVKLHGFVSKKTTQGRQLLDDLFSQAHFFILPTRADCTPIVFSESCSFGLPVLTTNVGGIPTVIRDGKNGFTFGLGEGPEAYCEVIERLWSSREAYEQLALSAFTEYAERLNWDTAGKKAYELIRECCG